MLYGSSGVADEAERLGIGNAALGLVKSRTELCQGCHGETGNSSSAEFPRLSGQYAGYIAKQLQDFRSGQRQHPVMSAMASQLSAADAEDIASYFASNSASHGQGSEATEAIQRLFAKGDAKRSILACAGCHGDKGQGAYLGGEVFPVLAGQHKFYLREQLLNWRSGSRRNSPGGVMNMIAQALTTEEIEALASYISAM